MNLTNFAENNLVDALKRGQALGAPATSHYALFIASKGIRANSTLYALNDTLVVLVNAAYRLYRVTTAGNSAAAQPGAYAGVAGEAITDGTAVMTEHSAALDDGTGIVEPSGGGYGRVAVANSLANFAGTQGAGTTTASSGTSGQTSNNVPITWPAPTADWQASGARIVGVAEFDANVAGNAWIWKMLAVPKTINNGDAAPSIAAGADTFSLG
ncbi:MAG: hypothetical protein C0423_19845 [Methylibium sp.]|nr:hypothetical protein [Methylibium sp.]